MKITLTILCTILTLCSCCQQVQFEIGPNLNFGKYAFKRKGAIASGINLGLAKQVRKSGEITLNTSINIFQNRDGKDDNAVFGGLCFGYNYYIVSNKISLFLNGGPAILAYKNETAFSVVVSPGIGWKKHLTKNYISVKSFFNYVNTVAMPEYRWITFQLCVGFTK